MKINESFSDENDVLSAHVSETTGFDAHHVLHHLQHFLPTQAPLKDFVHHNTLHAFQNLKFFDALRDASEIFGYKTRLSLSEYRAHFASGRIKKPILERLLATRKSPKKVSEWLDKLLARKYDTEAVPRIGILRGGWKTHYKIDLDSLVHPILFRILCSYLDQGISMWQFPVWHKGFLASLKEIEKGSFTSFFRGKRAKSLLVNTDCQLKDLLDLLIGDESLYEQYIFDQQFAHQGWSGMVSAIETQPQSLLDTKKITLEELIRFELLLEIDALDFQLGDTWQPLSRILTYRPTPLFDDVPKTELHEVYEIWQEAFEWSYYDEVLRGVIEKREKIEKRDTTQNSFQAMFCIDDRECSLRRYVEQIDDACETFGTPGFFGVEFFYKPEHGKFYTKLCPAPVTPKYLIKELDTTHVHEKDVHFTKHSHKLVQGWLIAQTLGFWSAFKLFLNVFRPTMTPAMATSLKHMDKFAKLTILNDNTNDVENGLQVGFTIAEMTERVEGLLKSIGLVKNFASIVYVVGHGSSSVNNPHYAAYDCGACCGRPGSVNARVVCAMANNPEVRALLREKGIEIPETTQFVGALHDTTRDEIVFYDEDSLNADNAAVHLKHEATFHKALDLNAKERSRRFESIDTNMSAADIHKQILTRSVSLFEPRPELNHATNALCIVGRRSLTEDLFLDRRSFLNSYDYRIDPEGTFLFNILKAAAPVCGGINLEYYFSRVDNQKLGAGSKLPHNVMGLFGVANGIDGDLRPGLPSQMIEVHDPVRLMIIVEHYPEVVLKTIQKAPETYEWFINEWVRLVVVNPDNQALSVFENGHFAPYTTYTTSVEKVGDVMPILEKTMENLPIYII